MFTKRNQIFYVIVIVSFFIFAFDIPSGWFQAGSKPDSYDMGIDIGAGRDGKNAATIKSRQEKINGFGTLMQECMPGNYLGRRVRMSAFVKSQDVENKAGLWLRVDEVGSKQPLAFDNMADRPIKGTTDWKKYEIVLDVPGNASNLAYGALLAGTGQIWFDDLKFEIVDSTISTTRGLKQTDMRLNQPTNLDFEK